MVEIFEAGGDEAMDGGMVEEDSKATGAGGVEAVGGDMELLGDVEDGIGKEIEDDGFDGGGFGDGEEGLVHVGVVEAEKAKDEGFVVGRGDLLEGKGNWREVVEDDGRKGGSDVLDVAISGADVEVGLGDNNGDAESGFHSKQALAQLHH